MGAPILDFNSYVDIATCMSMPFRSRSTFTPSSSMGESDSWTEKYFDHDPLQSLKMEWSKRIEQWQQLLPNRGSPVEDCESLADLEFSALFLQHPISAMSLWNAMEAFYALDRLVCYPSNEAPNMIAEWKAMPFFPYMENEDVWRQWETALEKLGKEINDHDNDDAASPPTARSTSSLLRFDELLGVSRRILNEREDRNNKEALRRRIAGISSGVAKLEEAQVELKRNLRQNLDDARLEKMMTERITVAAKRRFSMIKSYLKISEEGNESTGLALSTRRGSLDMVKSEVHFAWTSTRRGEATLSGIVMLLTLLVILNQLQLWLVARPEPIVLDLFEY